MAGSLQPAVPSGEENNVCLTTALWDGMDRHTLRDDYGAGYGITKRFVAPSVYATTVAQDGIYPFLDTSDTIRGGTRLGGGLVFTTAATDNNSPTIQWGGTTGAMFSVSTAAPKSLAFETIFRVGTIVETGVLIGLGEEGMAANNGCLVDDTGALADKDFIGFRGAMHASVLTISAVYRKSGQTEVVALTSALVPSVDTWYSLGLRFRAQNEANRGYLEWWVNGSKVKELLTTNTTAVPTATFPSAELLSPVFCLKAGEGVAKSMIVRSMDCYQKF
jgi:hypothetical protein